MATVTTLAGGKTSGRTAGSVPYFVDVEIDLAAAATAKGSALAAADVIEAISVPANTAIIGAGIEVITAPAGGTSFSVDLGVTGGDVDAFVDGFAVTGSAAGDYATCATAGPVVVGGTADTLDLLAIGTTPDTSGVLRVWAILMDVDGRIGADEVTRDVLA
jgi:hypothetical protein